MLHKFLSESIWTPTNTKRIIRNSLQLIYARKRNVHTIPNNITKVSSEVNPDLYNMIRFYIHNAISYAEPKWVDDTRKFYPYYSDEHVKHRVAGIINIMDSCERYVEVNFPVKMDDGSYKSFKGIRAEYSQHKLPVAGGTRFWPTEDESGVKGLAALMTVKLACSSIPWGGAKGAILLDPTSYSENELESIVRRYALELSKRKFLSPSVDITAGDVHFGPRECSWMLDTYSKTLGYKNINALAAIDGKPNSQGGLKKGAQAAGYGLYLAVDNFINEKPWMDAIGLTVGWADKTVIVQGFGEVGKYAARSMYLAGAKVIGIISDDSLLYNKNGINVEELINYENNNGSTIGYPKAEKYAGDERKLLQESCDILVPAKYQKTITPEIAREIKAKIIAEGANGCTTPAAHNTLLKKKVLVIPDLYANSGGAIAVYHEWLTNIRHVSFGRLAGKYNKDSYYHLFDTVEKSVKEHIKDAKITPTKEFLVRLRNDPEEEIMKSELEYTFEFTCLNIMLTAQQYGLNLDLRTAAYIYALDKIFTTYEETGLVL